MAFFFPILTSGFDQCAQDVLSTPEAQSSGKIPIIFLRDVTFTELACLLDFIYSGSGQLPPELVASFSRLAHELGLKGFVRNPDSLKMPPATPQKQLSEPVS